MAVDRGYGSGKPLSAAQSAARRTAAAKAAGRKKTIKRQAANPGVRLGVSRVGKTENAGFNIGGRKYLETGVSANKLLQVAKSLFEGGQTALAKSVGSRAEAKQVGRIFGGTGKKSQGLGLPMDRAVDAGGAARSMSESLYPRLPNASIPGSRRSFDVYEDPLLEGAGRFLGKRNELLKLKRRAGLTDPRNPESTYSGSGRSVLRDFTKIKKGR